MGKNTNPFILLLVIFLSVGSYLIFTVPKGEICQLFNQQYTPFWNHVFYYITFLGSGFPTFIICIGLLFYRFGDAVLLFVNSALAGTITLLFKYFFFDDVNRPKHFLEEIFAELNKVEDVYFKAYNSFPSGHTALAFATFFTLSVLIKDKRWAILFFFLALMTGLSRVYLLQHFFVDVYGGAIVGIFVPLMVFAILPATGFWQNRSWPGKALKIRPLRH